MAQQLTAPAGRDAKGRFAKGNQLSVGNSGQPKLLRIAPEIQREIVGHIRAGAFDWVAARAAGISAVAFYDYMKRGENGEPTFAEFANAVAQARAEGRLEREKKVAESEPLAWLMKGPGRDKPGEPGWTDRPSGTELPHVTIIVTDRWRV